MNAVTLLTLLGVSIAVAQDAAPGDEPTAATDTTEPEAPAAEPEAPAAEPEAPAAEPEAPAAEPEAAAPPPAPYRPSTRRYDDGRRWRNGMPLLWIYSCGMGSAMGATLGGIASDYGELAGSGLYVGGGAGALGMVFLRPDEISLDQSTLISSSGLLGAWSGGMLASALIPVGAEAEWDRIAASGVLGAAAGTAVGGLMKGAPPARNMLLVDISTFAGWQVGGGVADLMELDVESDRNQRAGLSLLGGGAFLAGSALAAREGFELDPGVMGLTLGHASWIGLWTPFLVSDNPEPQQVLGGMRLGLGAGTVAGIALSSRMELYPKSVGLQLGGLGAGTAIGAGIPLALGLDGHPRGVVGPMLLGGIAGQALGAAAAPHYDITPSDALLMGTIETWSLYQGLGWAVFMNNSDLDVTDSQAVGMGLAIAGVGTMAAGLMGPTTEFELAEAAMVGSGGAWGTWYGAWGGHLAGLSPEEHWAVTLVTGNLGLIGTAAAAGGSWDPGWNTVAAVDSLGLLGGAVGAMVGIIASPDLDAAAAGSLVGSTAGIVGGAVVARNAQGRLSGPGWGPLIPRPRLDLPFHTRVSAAPWVAESGDPGAMLSVSLTEK
jgi:hypothetical protein